MTIPFYIIRESKGITYICYSKHHAKLYYIMIIFEHLGNAVTCYFEYETKEERDFDMIHMENEWLDDVFQMHKNEMN